MLLLLTRGCNAVVVAVVVVVILLFTYYYYLNPKSVASNRDRLARAAERPIYARVRVLM